MLSAFFAKTFPFVEKKAGFRGGSLSSFNAKDGGAWGERLLMTEVGFMTVELLLRSALASACFSRVCKLRNKITLISATTPSARRATKLFLTGPCTGLLSSTLPKINEAKWLELELSLKSSFFWELALLDGAAAPARMATQATKRRLPGPIVYCYPLLAPSGEIDTSEERNLPQTFRPRST